ncbi:hypothetical protein ARSEF4850_007901, partial [Beauveria asiatica]
MSNDMFNCLVEDIEPADRKPWPPAVRDTLSKLTEKELHGCIDLEKLVLDLSQPLTDTMECSSPDLRGPPVTPSAQDQNLNR